jgi:AbrB family looped-hinge helix DNA binding protein
VEVSRATDKFQVTIPKDVREALGLKAGEEVVVETGPRSRIIVKRFPTTKSPLKVLIGKKPYPRHVPLEELEERIETR